MAFFGDEMNICILGNTARHHILFSNLKGLGFNVSLFDTMPEPENTAQFDFVVLPIPTLKENRILNLEGCSANIEHILNKFTSNTVFITCNYTSEDYKTVDINKRDDFAYLNAIPTAEGAIEIAIDKSNSSLFYSNVLITGFGRVAKILANRLKGLCPNIVIAARSQSSLAEAAVLGFKTVAFNSFKENNLNYDIVFQTVPSLVLNENVLCKFKKDVIIIELSSKSIGTDCLLAEKLGITVVHAPALPEKIAPATAGNILTETVLKIINENSTPY